MDFNCRIKADVPSGQILKNFAAIVSVQARLSSSLVFSVQRDDLQKAWSSPSSLFSSCTRFSEKSPIHGARWAEDTRM